MMADNRHRPERVRFILADMKRMGGRTLAYAKLLEELLDPVLDHLLKSREASKVAVRKYREAHPEYREKCRISAAAANERRRLARLAGKAAANPRPTANGVEADGCPVG